MRKFVALVAGLAASMCMSSVVLAQEETLPNTLEMGKFKVEWADEFDGDALNTDVWNYCIGNNGDNGTLWGWGNNELQYYTDKEENVKVGDGTLKLMARSEKIGGCDYSSGRLNSAGKVEVGYGYVEARIKLPAVNGIWPAFWMLGANEPKGWPYCGEIDILESWNTGDFAQNCLHYADANGKDNYDNFYKKMNIGKTEWHTYGVYKTKTKLAFYYDGQRASKIIDITNEEMTEMHNDYYILLNVACGGNLSGNIAPAVADLPATMEVDYVRYYRDKTAEELAAEQPETTTATQAATTKIQRAVIQSLKNNQKKAIKVSLKKLAGVSGYEIYYSNNKKFQGYAKKTAKKNSVTIKGLKKKKTYWVKARAYQTVKKTKNYGAWSKVKKIKITK